MLTPKATYGRPRESFRPKIGWITDMSARAVRLRLATYALVNPITDDRDEYETIDYMSQPHHVGSLNGDNKWTAHGATTVDEVFIIIRYTHPDEPDVHHKESDHSPIDRFDCLADCLPRLYGLAGNDSNVLA